MACIFNSEWFIRKYVPNCSALLRSENRSIRDNPGNLISSVVEPRNSAQADSPGGIDENVLFKDRDGKTALEKEIEYFGARMSEYPDVNVIYRGKPLMLIFLGAAQGPNPADNPLWFKIRKFLKNHPAIERKYTFRMVAGYLDSQLGLWLTQGPPSGPVEIDSKYGFWSWVDRLNTSCTAPLCPYYPSYNAVRINGVSRVENFTASIATAGQNGWGCPNENTQPYCPDASLRFDENHATLRSTRSWTTRFSSLLSF